MKSNQTEWDKWFLDMAKHASLKSKDPSTQTGAVIVRPNNTVVSMGYNGFPQSMPDKQEYYDNREEKYDRIVHCEMNALLFSYENLDGCTLYTYPFMSCSRCFVHMAQAGIRRFVYPKATEDQLKRWGDSFKRTLGYADEMGLMMVEI